MTTKTTRRAILAGAAALPALTMPAFTAPAEADDPIFELIENHKQAHAELRDALEQKNNAEEIWKAEHGSLRANVLIATRAEWEAEANAPRWPLSDLSDLSAPADEFRVHSGAALRALFRNQQSDVYRKLRAELAATKRRYNAVFKPIDRKIATLHGRIEAAEWMMYAIPPTTWGGIMAVLRYIREEQFVSECLNGDSDALHALLNSIEMAMHDLTGTKPPAELAVKFEPVLLEEAERMMAAVA